MENNRMLGSYDDVNGNVQGMLTLPVIDNDVNLEGNQEGLDPNLYGEIGWCLRRFLDFIRLFRG
jgi:hypothetical protein